MRIAPRPVHLTRRRGAVADEGAQQRGLPHTVPADQRDALPHRHADVDVGEEGPAADLDGEPGGAQDAAHPSRSPGCSRTGASVRVRFSSKNPSVATIARNPSHSRRDPLDVGQDRDDRTEQADPTRPARPLDGDDRRADRVADERQAVVHRRTDVDVEPCVVGGVGEVGVQAELGERRRQVDGRLVDVEGPAERRVEVTDPIGMAGGADGLDDAQHAVAGADLGVERLALTGAVLHEQG